MFHNFVNLGHFRTFSSGVLIGQKTLAYNYTQNIKCTPNKEYDKVLRVPVYHLKKGYTGKSTFLFYMLND